MLGHFRTSRRARGKGRGALLSRTRRGRSGPGLGSRGARRRLVSLARAPGGRGAGRGAAASVPSSICAQPFTVSPWRYIAAPSPRDSGHRERPAVQSRTAWRSCPGGTRPVLGAESPTGTPHENALDPDVGLPGPGPHADPGHASRHFPERRSPEVTSLEGASVPRVVLVPPWGAGPALALGEPSFPSGLDPTSHLSAPKVPPLFLPFSSLFSPEKSLPEMAALWEAFSPGLHTS